MDSVTIKIDKKVKQAAQKHARREGVSLANLFASNITSFYTSASPVNSLISREKLNTKTRRELTKISRDIKEGKNLSPAFRTVKEMKKYLMA